MARSLLISGASSGIGHACALAFDREGWTVFAGVRREADGLSLASQASDRLQWLILDVTDPSHIASARDRVERALGGRGLDALINNAGVAIAAPVEFVSREDLRRQFEVNVFGLVEVTQSFLPLLRQARGRIVNIGSIAGRVTTPLMSPYCASKHAVEAITDALRLELKPWGIEVAVIEPGVVATPIWDKGTSHLQERLTTMPAVALELYAPLLAAFRGLMRRAPGGAMSTDAVVRAVAHALHSPRPRTRYVVGRVARVRLLLQSILPRRWMDGIIHRVLRREAAQAA